MSMTKLYVDLLANDTGPITSYSQKICFNSRKKLFSVNLCQALTDKRATDIA